MSMVTEEEELVQRRNRSIRRKMKMGYSVEEIKDIINLDRAYNRTYTLTEVEKICEEIKLEEEKDGISKGMALMNDNMGGLIDMVQQSISNGDIKASAASDKGDVCKDELFIHNPKHRMALYHAKMAKKGRDEKEKRLERAFKRNEPKLPTEVEQEPQKERSWEDIIPKAALRQKGIDAICESAIKLTNNRQTLNLIVLDPKTGNALEVSASRLLSESYYNIIRSKTKNGEDLITALYFLLKENGKESCYGDIFPRGINSLREYIASLDYSLGYSGARERLLDGFTLEQAINPLPKEAARKNIHLPKEYKTLDEFCNKNGIDIKLFKHELERASNLTWKQALEQTIKKQKKK